MTSRISCKALKPDSPDMHFLESFLEYIDRWEESTKPSGGGFLTDSTATGLRVTIQSTIDLLSYLHSQCGFKYLLTSRLSQDKLENLFGIIRQSSGCNDHPTVSQFLITVNLMAFFNLANSPKGGNCSQDVVKALLSPTDAPNASSSSLLDALDGLLEQGKVDDVDEAIQAVSEGDHEGYNEKRSNSALLYYVSGYVARKIIAKTACPDCASHLYVNREKACSNANVYFTAKFDNGGLVYPSPALSEAIQLMEGTFTSYFSKNELNVHSLPDIVNVLSSVTFPKLGCLLHEKATVVALVKFYILLRFRFLLKGLNKERDGHRERVKLLKQRRCR